MLLYNLPLLNIISYCDFNLLGEKLFYLSFDLLDTLPLVFIIVVPIMGVMILFSAGRDKIIKQIGQLGTGVLAAIGTMDSTLNLYDRYMDSQSNSGDSNKNSGNNGDSNNDSGNTNNDDSNKESGNNGDSNNDSGSANNDNSNNDSGSANNEDSSQN